MAKTREVNTTGSQTQNQADQNIRKTIQITVDTKKVIQKVRLLFAATAICVNHFEDANL